MSFIYICIELQFKVFFFITKKLNFRTFSFKDSKHISSSSLFFAYLITPGDIQEALQ